MATATASTKPAGRSWYAITLQGEDEATVRIYEDIGVWGVSAKQFSDDIEELQVGKLHVRLNSYGGEAFDGLAIYNSLRAHPADIIIHIDGIAASAASIIAMAGDEIRMADNAFLMIHEGRGGVWGEADEMRKYAELLDKLNDSIAATYQGRAGKTRKYWRQKMADESWFTADEARTEGLSDKTDDRETQAENRFDFRIYNQIQHVPEAVQKAWGRRPAAVFENGPLKVADRTNETQAPEGPRCSEPPPAEPKQEAIMADTAATAPPAQDSAAGSGQESKQGNAADAHKAEMERLKGLTTEAQYQRGWDDGHKSGVSLGDEQAVKRLEAILAACPGDYKMAIESFQGKQSPEAVKLAFDKAQAVATAAAEREREKDLEIARLRQQAATGGYPGGVNLGLTAGDNGDDGPMDRDHAKAQAEREWDTQPAVRRTAKTKEIYVAARTAELDGSHRTFSRQTANA